jgi:hypothetical protein
MAPQEVNPFSPPMSAESIYTHTPDQRPTSIDAYTPEKLTPVSTRPTSPTDGHDIVLQPTLAPTGALPLKDVDMQSEDAKEALDHATASLCKCTVQIRWPVAHN